MELLEVLLWGRKVKELCQTPSPSSPSSPKANNRWVKASAEPAQPALAISSGTTLLAPRYNGGEPLMEVPFCWCCRAPYRLDWLQECHGRAYAWLVPSCGCLDAPQALSCCGLCFGHQPPACRKPRFTHARTSQPTRSSP